METYGGYKYFDHEPSKEEREQALRELLEALTPAILDSADIIVKRAALDDHGWTVALKLTLQKRPDQQGRQLEVNGDAAPRGGQR